MLSNISTISVSALNTDPLLTTFSAYIQKQDTQSLEAKTTIMQRFQHELEELECASENKVTQLYALSIFSAFSSCLSLAGLSLLNPLMGVVIGVSAVGGAAGVIGGSVAINSKIANELPKLKRYAIALKSANAKDWAKIWMVAGDSLFIESLISASKGNLDHQGKIVRNDKKNALAASLDYCSDRLGVSRAEILEMCSKPTASQKITDRLPTSLLPTIAISAVTSTVETVENFSPTPASLPTSPYTPVATIHNQPTVLQSNSTLLQTSREAPNNALDLTTLKTLPLHERAIAVINLLNRSGFNVAECVRKQSNVVCGNQRGGKGTLVGLLCILYQALDSATKVNYFTAGADIYPFHCQRVCSALDYPYAPDPNAKVANEFIKFLKQIEKELSKPEGIGARKGEVLVLDEAITLSDGLTDEDLQWMAKFLMTRFSKSGSKLFIILHASNLTSWIGSKNTAGISRTFKSDFSFVGCVATSVKVNVIDTIQVATGEYFIANPDSWGEPAPNGELGIIPDWLKTETNPNTGMPDPVRTLLMFFPELTAKGGVETHNANVIKAEVISSQVNQVNTVESAIEDGEEEEVKEVVLTSRPSRENDLAFVKGVSLAAKEYMNEQEWANSTPFDVEKLRKTKAFSKLEVSNGIGLNKVEAQAVLDMLEIMGVVVSLNHELYECVALARENVEA